MYPMSPPRIQTNIEPKISNGPLNQLKTNKKVANKKIIKRIIADSIANFSISFSKIKYIIKNVKNKIAKIIIKIAMISNPFCVRKNNIIILISFQL